MIKSWTCQKFGWFLLSAVFFSSFYWLMSSKKPVTTSNSPREVHRHSPPLVPHEYSLSWLQQRIECLKGNKDEKSDHARLTSIVQSAITKLQNPKDCSQAKKLLCYLTYAGCGFGCVISHTTYCLLVALATGRVLVLSDHPWYGMGPTEEIALKTILAPLSTTCTNYTGDVKDVVEVDPEDPTLTVAFNSEQDGVLFFSLRLSNQPYTPPAIHPGIVDSVFSLTDEPEAWWHGQFTGYLMRPKDSIKERLSKEKEKLDFSSPVVGVHIRRTEKHGTTGGGFIAAQNHEVEEYMDEVEMWFQVYEMTHGKVERKVYLATDTAKTVEECHSKYPNWKIYSNAEIANTAEVPNRGTEESVIGIIQDIHMLSMTNFVICTISSNVCNLVYTLLHFRHGKASHMLHSLDIPYSPWPYLFDSEFEAVESMPATNLARGDRLKTVIPDRGGMGNYWTIGDDGVYRIRTENQRTGETQEYPRHMLKLLPKLFNFTNFDLSKF